MQIPGKNHRRNPRKRYTINFFKTKINFLQSKIDELNNQNSLALSDDSSDREKPPAKKETKAKCSGQGHTGKQSKFKQESAQEDSSSDTPISQDKLAAITEKIQAENDKVLAKQENKLKVTYFFLKKKAIRGKASE